MATSSIQEELAVDYPTCIDYPSVSYPNVKVIPTRSPAQCLTNFNARSIGEDEEREMLHVLKYREGDIDVFSYKGLKLFSYPRGDLISRFRPRGMSIRNNIVYVTSLMGNQLTLFTTDGEFITFYKDIIKKGEKLCLKRPRGLVSDEDNNIYVCTTTDIVVMNSVLPVYQVHGMGTARPKDIHLFKGKIFVLSWQQSSVSINVLSLDCKVLKTIFLKEFHIGTKPWYFDMDQFGHLVIPSQGLNAICVYSSDGEIIIQQPLKLVVKPRGIKLFNHKRIVGLTSSSPFGFCIF